MSYARCTFRLRYILGPIIIFLRGEGPKLSCDVSSPDKKLSLKFRAEYFVLTCVYWWSSQVFNKKNYDFRRRDLSHYFPTRTCTTKPTAVFCRIKTNKLSTVFRSVIRPKKTTYASSDSRNYPRAGTEFRATVQDDGVEKRTVFYNGHAGVDGFVTELIYRFFFFLFQISLKNVSNSPSPPVPAPRGFPIAPFRLAARRMVRWTGTGGKRASKYFKLVQLVPRYPHAFK